MKADLAGVCGVAGGGHESVGTTDRRYGHFDRSASVVSAAAFESMMPGVRRGMVSDS
jgi:hypothetical protein